MRLAHAAAALALAWCEAGCVTVYHPEYHPETTYNYAQNATYVNHAIFVSGLAGRSTSETIDELDADAHATPCLRDLSRCPRGVVRSPGGIIIYGNYTGNIYLGR